MISLSHVRLLLKEVALMRFMMWILKSESIWCASNLWNRFKMRTIQSHRNSNNSNLKITMKESRNNLLKWWKTQRIVETQIWDLHLLMALNIRLQDNNHSIMKTYSRISTQIRPMKKSLIHSISWIKLINNACAQREAIRSGNCILIITSIIKHLKTRSMSWMEIYMLRKSNRKKRQINKESIIVVSKSMPIRIQ